MLFKEFKTIYDLIDSFPDEQSCIDFLEHQKWGNNPVSPFDPSSKVWKCKDNRYKCKNTGKYFNIKSNTLFEGSRVPLRKWFISIWFITTKNKGMSSVQLSKQISVDQKTAWFMMHRIRECFHIEDDIQMEGVLELDESFCGGKNKNRHKGKKIPMSTGRAFKDKTPVLGVLERGKTVKCFVIPDTKRETIQPIIRRIIKPWSTIVSDEWSAYKGLDDAYDHHIVDHSRKQYVNPDNPEIHTNTIEGFWGIFKRGYNGIYNWMSRKNLQRYMDEFAFRYNHRKRTYSERFYLFLQNISHRLKYRQLIGKQVWT